MGNPDRGPEFVSRFLESLPMDHNYLPVEAILPIDEGSECWDNSVVAARCVVVKCDQGPSREVRNIDPKLFEKG
jgi:hypothetical protein